MHARRAFTLLEAVMVVIILAITVPPTVYFLQDSAANRKDAVMAARASFLAQGIMEQVLADAQSTADGQGFAQLSDMNTYLNKSPGGFLARTTTLAQPYTSAEMTFTVSAGNLVNSAGVTTGNASEDLFRVMTVTVQYNSAHDGSTMSVPISAMVADL